MGKYALGSWCCGWVVVLCIASGSALANGDSPEPGFDRAYLDSLPEIVVNESPVAVPVAKDGAMFRFTTAERGIYRVRTETATETPFDTVLFLFEPDEDGHPEYKGVNDDVREGDTGSELNRHLDKETEYVIGIEPYVDEDIVPIETNNTLRQQTLVQVTGPIHPSVFPLGEMIHVFDFSEDRMRDTGWKEIPGGFLGLRGGDVDLVEFDDDTFEDSADNRGIRVRVRNHQLSFLHMREPILSTGKPVVVRMTYRANKDDAELYLAALRGHLTRNIDLVGSVVVNQVNDLGRANRKERTLELIYRQPEGTYITPLIQIAGNGGRTTVYIDKVVVFELSTNAIFLDE